MIFLNFIIWKKTYDFNLTSNENEIEISKFQI